MLGRHARTVRFAASGRVWAAADGLAVFFGRLVAQLLLRGFSFTTADLEDVVRSALRGLIQRSTA